MKKVLAFTKEHGVIILFGTIILAILLKDILSQFVWKTAIPFRANSIYVFLAYLICFTEIPILLVEKYYKNRHKNIKLEEYKDSCSSAKDVPRIVIGGIGKVILIIGFIFLIVVISSWISEYMLGKTIDISKAYIFCSDFSHLPMAVGIGMLILFVWLFSKRGLVRSDVSDDAKMDFFSKRERACLPWREKIKIASIAVFCYAIFLVFPSLSYNCVTEDGVLHKRFWYEKRYTWADADSYSYKYLEKNVETLVLEMKDGHKVILWEYSIFHFPEDKYPNGEDDFYQFVLSQIRF